MIPISVFIQPLMVGPWVMADSSAEADLSADIDGAADPRFKVDCI